MKPPLDPEAAVSEVARVLQQDASQALERAETFLRSCPDPRLFRLAAEACRRLGLAEDAVSAEIAAIQAGLANAELGRAAATLSEDRSSDALAMVETYLKRQPDDLLALTIAAEAEINLWRLDLAEVKLRSVLARAPTFLRASMLLATCLIRLVRARDACDILDQVVARKPNNAMALTRLAQLRAAVRDVEPSIALHEKLVALEPDRPERRVDLAHQYRIVGRRDDAVRAFREALAIDPVNSAAWWSLANYFASEIDERDETAISGALEQNRGASAESGLQLTLGLIKDRKKHHEQAFKLLVAGKKALFERRPFDPNSLGFAVDEVIRTVTPDFYARRSAGGWPDSAPIFIVGMPRSGTTLVERILGVHSAIEAAGELPVLQRCADLYRHQFAHPENYAAVIDAISDNELRSLGERYILASKDYRHSDKSRFTDKSNLNWMHVGLILIAFPNAKIIDVRRNAVDCCWANFKVFYPEGFPEANDLAAIGGFYAEYVRLMDAMRHVAPDRILTVRYEDVVNDIASATRRMLDFAGLPFEPACLDFHLSTDAVATPSSEQVRQPINRKGIGSSEAYRQWLGPLRDALGPLADA
jgi:tetratricopeptide (TPR) repeat protein